MKTILMMGLLLTLAGCANTPRVKDTYRGSPQAAKDLVLASMGYPLSATISPIDMSHADQIIPVDVTTDSQRCLFIIGRVLKASPYGWVVIDRSTKCDRLD